jgi:hypothetical protein
LPCEARSGAVLGGRHVEALADRAIERSDGNVAALQRDGQDRQVLGRQPGGGFLQPVMVQESR